MDTVVHSYEVHLELDQLFSFVKSAESGQQGYIISHDSIFLQFFNEGRDKVSKSIIKIIKLTGDNPQQRNNLDSLYQLINMRFALLVNSLEQNLMQHRSEFRYDINLLKGKDLMDMIFLQINKMIDFEMNYNHEQQQKYKQETFFTPFFSLYLLFFSLTIFTFSYFKINRDLEKSKQANEELIIKNESIRHAESIGEFSTWQWDLETDDFIYSDNQYRLLGCEPKSFMPSLTNYLQFVHPDDRHLFIRKENEISGADENPTIAFYRIIRKDNQVRYFKSIGRLLTDVNGKKVVIGINCDITDQRLSGIALQERSLELERTNKELANFNHMASHDLQEPLRKIETFISRINSNYTEELPQTLKFYLQRINSAAESMRVLIDDLLLFARTNKVEKLFIRTNLDDILKDVIQELKPVMDEKNATIEKVNLPVIDVIPYQIHQLFKNLIENSLKYQRLSVSPVIKITSNLVHSKDYSFIKHIDQKIIKIEFSDNGIGFDEQYAESIFKIFYRLHHVSEHPGTGMGLAICKKIVENHNGFISAKGTPGNGAVFSIYLPIPEIQA
jgi:signal transduction histidine kinase/CHASE3 domain sensor protein